MAPWAAPPRTDGSIKSAKPPRVRKLRNGIKSAADSAERHEMTDGADWTFLGYFFKNSAEVVAAVIRVNLPTAPHLLGRLISDIRIKGGV